MGDPTIHRLSDVFPADFSALVEFLKMPEFFNEPPHVLCSYTFMGWENTIFQKIRSLLCTSNDTLLRVDLEAQRRQVRVYSLLHLAQAVRRSADELYFGLKDQKFFVGARRVGEVL